MPTPLHIAILTTITAAFLIYGGRALWRQYAAYQALAAEMANQPQSRGHLSRSSEGMAICG